MYTILCDRVVHHKYLLRENVIELRNRYVLKVRIVASGNEEDENDEISF